MQLRSRNNNDFNPRYPAIVKVLADLPDETVVDGEVVALDGSGRPSFSALQNFSKSGTTLSYFLFDVLVLSGTNLMSQPLSMRRELLREQVLVRFGSPIHGPVELNASLHDILRAVREQGMEGIVAKKLTSIYEPGARSGAWQKMRINKRQDFVIGGYTLGARNFDAVIFGYYEGEKLFYAGRTRNGFTASSKEQLYRRFHQLETTTCPFVNLPEAKAGRWGQGLTAEKMKDCRWLLCRMRHRSHNVECRTMPHVCGRTISKAVLALIFRGIVRSF